MATKKFLFNWTKFFIHELISATVEQGAKSNIVLTFTSIKPFNRAVKGEFTTTGSGAARTCSTLTKSVSANTLTLAMNAAYVLNETMTLTFNPTLKGKTVTKVIDNNIIS